MTSRNRETLRLNLFNLRKYGNSSNHLKNVEVFWCNMEKTAIEISSTFRYCHDNIYQCTHDRKKNVSRKPKQPNSLSLILTFDVSTFRYKDQLKGVLAYRVPIEINNVEN